mmetsp:Transcript_57085/g.119373  ORF Transcript_57085/g.119373 Transcript_57085/m.119373 type:complete len:240 (-) Transcript_57085:374-1093(-)
MYASTLVNSGLCVASTPSLRKHLPSSYTRSIPPITSLFRYSSGATRRNSSDPSTWLRVTKGRAAAPHAAAERTGVSTSRNPRASRNPRTPRTTAARRTKAFRESALASRSRCRCRYRKSASRSPKCSLGNRRTQGARMVRSVPKQHTSPRWFRPTYPCTPIKSPRRIPRAPDWEVLASPAWRRKSKSVLKLLRSHMICTFAPSPLSSRKTRDFPDLRIVFTRPARETHVSGRCSPGPKH